MVAVAQFRAQRRAALPGVAGTASIDDRGEAKAQLLDRVVGGDRVAGPNGVFSKGKGSAAVAKFQA